MIGICIYSYFSSLNPSISPPLVLHYLWTLWMSAWVIHFFFKFAFINLILISFLENRYHEISYFLFKIEQILNFWWCDLWLFFIFLLSECVDRWAEATASDSCHRVWALFIYACRINSVVSSKMYNEAFPGSDVDSSHFAQVSNVLKRSQITLMARRVDTEDEDRQQLKNTGGILPLDLGNISVSILIFFTLSQ